jgi:PhnB protein
MTGLGTNTIEGARKMATTNPYLSFDGNAEEAFNFYKSVFGGEFSGFMRWKDNPQCSEFSEADKNMIMHVALPMGEGNFLLGSDSPESMGQKLTKGNNFQIALGPDSKEDTDRIFKALSEGGKVVMPPADMFWGAYFGMLEDKFGIHWMLNYEYPK